MDWLEQLRSLPPERCFVEHEPPTPRYGRAQQKLRYIIRNAVFLGVLQRPESVEIAVWCKPGHGKGAGYYACFRLDLDESRVLAFAALFCFYDGTDQSPGFKKLQTARMYASQRGFTEEQADGHDRRA